VLELETDKATIEVPSGVSGVIKEIMVKEGGRAEVGQVIFTVDADGAAPKAEPEPEEEKGEEKPAESEATPKPEPEPTPEPTLTPTPAPEPAPAAKKLDAAPAPAAPSVRRLARELGVDIHVVPGSGPGGRISQDDVKTYVKKLNTERAAAPIAVSTAAIAAAPLPDFTKFGEVESNEQCAQGHGPPYG